MKRTGMILLAVFAAVCICSCTSSEKQNNEKSLIVFNYGDYIDRDVLEQFEEETGIPDGFTNIWGDEEEKEN